MRPRKLAMEAPPENFAFTVMLGKDSSQHDGIAVVDLREGSENLWPDRSYGNDADHRG